MSDLKISQFNVQSLNNKKHELINFLHNCDIDICLLNETWLQGTDTVSIPNYHSVYKNSSNPHNGVGILIKKGLDYNIINTTFYENFQNVAISLQTSLGSLSILCVYSPPNRRLNFRQIKNIIGTLPQPILIAGDWNGHHPAFGGLSSTSRGNSLFDLFDECDFCILNTGCMTTLNRPNNRPSAIDVTVVSSNLAPFCTWKVHDDCMGSYHFPTIVEIKTQPNKIIQNNSSKKYVYKKADWKKYHELSKHHFVNIDSSENALEQYDQFCSYLDVLKDECIPVSQPSSFSHKKNTPMIWWNDICKQRVDDAKLKLNNYRHNMTMENYIEYKKANALKKRTIKEQKTLSWHNLCASFNRMTPVTRIWNFIKKMNNLTPNSNPVRHTGWIDRFLDKIAQPPSDLNNDAFLDKYFSHPCNIDNQFLIQPFLIEELEKALINCKDSTPGLDLNTYSTVKNLHRNAKTILLGILNDLWFHNLIPKSWKTQCVVPILKPDKDPNSENSYRPISLASCVGKVFEKMIKLRLEWFIEKNNLIPDVQFGFRRGRSAQESFTAFISDLNNSKIMHLDTVCAFVDVEGAFDSVDPPRLVKVLYEIGFPGKFIKWIYRFLNDRTVYVKYNNNLFGPKSAFKGTMQGSVLSPLLYNLYTSQLCEYVNMHNVQILQFADDLVLYSKHKSLFTAKKQLNQSLQELKILYKDKLKLKINPDKSNLLIFSKQDHNIGPDIKYDNTPIPSVQQKRFLGVIVDNKLSFKDHINYISAKALKRFNIMKYLAGVSWGSDPVILSMIYKSIVRSHFDYSCLAYQFTSPQLLKKLDVIQNKGLRVICGAMCSTPIHSLEAESGIQPLAIRRLLFTYKFALKLIASNQNNVLNKLTSNYVEVEPFRTSAQRIINNHIPKLCTFINEAKTLSKQMLITARWPCFLCKYESLPFKTSVNTSSVHNNFDFLEYVSDRPTFYRIYTDGSLTAEHVQCAFFDPENFVLRCFKLNPLSSIFTAEAFAIYQALLYFQETPETQLLLISDSKSVLTSIENISISYKTNYVIHLIKDELIVLNSMNKMVEFLWVPSHSGISGNEIVDRAANLEADVDLSSVFKVPFSDYFVIIKKHLKDLWQEYFDIKSIEKGKWYYEIQKNIPTNPWFKKEKPNCRKYFSYISRLRFNHGQFPAHLHKIRLSTSDRCIYCSNNVIGDLDHIFMSCPAFNLQRLVMVDGLLEIYNNNKDSVPNQLCPSILSNSKCYGVLYNFLINSLGKI